MSYKAHMFSGKFKTTISVIIAIAVFICGMIVTGYQVINSAQQVNIQIAHRTLGTIESLLDGARNTANLASKLLSAPCSKETQTELERIIINARYVRLIALYKNNNIHCSSFSDADAISNKQ